jgi:hypothetical protein
MNHGLQMPQPVYLHVCLQSYVLQIPEMSNLALLVRTRSSGTRSEMSKVILSRLQPGATKRR